MAFALDSDRVVTADSYGKMYQWNTSCLDTEAVRIDLPGHEGAVNDLAISLDSRWIISCGDDGTARRWDSDLPVPGDSSIVYRSCEAEAAEAAVNDRGTALAVGTNRGDIRLYDLTAKEPIRSVRSLLTPDPTNGIESVRFLHVDSLIATTKRGPIRWWHPCSRSDEATSATLEGHDESVFSMSASGDGKRLATADLKGVAWLWELGHPVECRSIEFPWLARKRASNEYPSVPMVAGSSAEPTTRSGGGTWRCRNFRSQHATPRSMVQCGRSDSIRPGNGSCARPTTKPGFGRCRATGNGRNPKSFHCIKFGTMWLSARTVASLRPPTRKAGSVYGHSTRRKCPCACGTLRFRRHSDFRPVR